MSQPEAHAGAADFDFFIGSWRVAHHRLKERLAGCTAWEDFTGSCVAQKILGGLGNMDDNVIGLPGGAYRAITLRAFNPATMSNAGQARWEQAFSPDRGQSWETNWIMDFRRADAV